jgi:glycosyltransferase involved in cell wall biosynthesis
MLLENATYPADVRVRAEAETLVAAGYRVTVIAPRGGPEQSRRESIGGVEVVRFWLPETAQSMSGFIAEYAVAHFQLARLTFARLLAGADIVHINNPPDTLSFLLVLARILGRRTVFDNHDLFPELFQFRYGASPFTRLLRVFQRLAFRQADVVITTNESQREIVLDAVARDPGSVVVVRNGPHRDTVQRAPRAPQDAAAARAPLEILFLGALEPQDGVVTLAHVLRTLVDRHRLDPRLTVLGTGSSQVPLERICSELGVRERLVFTGWVAHADVPRLLAQAHVCVDPAPCNELNHRSTMIKIAEYIAAGRPIVAFDLRETRRTAGDAALYAACGDVEGFAARIAEIANSAELRDELAEHAERRLPQLLWEHSAQALVAAYGRLPSRC